MYNFFYIHLKHTHYALVTTLVKGIRKMIVPNGAMESVLILYSDYFTEIFFICNVYA